MMLRPFLALLLAQAVGAQAPAFEVASIKLSPTLAGICRGGPGSTSPGQWNCTSSLRLLVSMAWGVASYQLFAPPALDQEFFNIVAKVPPNTGKPEFYLMIQKLLTERLGVVVHRETRQQTVYDLTVAKGGPKLKEAEAAPAGGPALDANGFPVNFVRDAQGNAQLPPGRAGVFDTWNGPNYRIAARLHGTARIANLLEAQVSHHVIDKTGLTGKYDYVLEFLPGPGSAAALQRPPAVSAGEASMPGLSIFEAVVQQLGLKLTSRKGPVDVVVVDRFQNEPTEN